MKYQPYSPNWTRYRALQESIYDYLEDSETPPEQICEDMRDVLEEWVNEYSSRAEKGSILIDMFK
jgi:RNase adaptor protein for sRNA GlmZ degradation